VSESHDRAVIGVVGGVGPFAGLDLNQKIFDNTRTHREQDHLEVYLLSCSARIADRTEYLLHPDAAENPAEAIYQVIEKLSRIGATVVGVPCNTSHSPPIWNRVLERMEESGLRVDLLNMIEETRLHIRAAHPDVETVGLLATRGTYASRLYERHFERSGGLGVLVPGPDEQETVHAAIYDPAYGIKNHPNPISRRAVESLSETARRLIDRGAQAVVMGCTEIPLALRRVQLPVPRIDTTVILARALVARVAPELLTPETGKA